MTDHIEASKKRLTDDEFREAANMWRSGDFTLDELSDRFGVSKTALHRRFKRNNISKGEFRKQEDEAILEEMARKAQERAAEYANSFEDIRDFGFKLNNAILRRVAKEISESTQRNTSLALIKDTMTTLEKAQSIVNKAFESARNIATDILPKEEESKLPSLRIESLSPEEIEELRRLQELEEQELYGTSPGDSDSLLDDVENLD